MIIAVDGPSAAGKGTLSRKLAAHFGLAHLDTGALYRAVALAILRTGGDPADPDTCVAAAKALAHETLDDPEIRSERTAAAASRLAPIPEVRAVLLAFQRNFATNPPGNAQGEVKGAVLDGRDIGTVICPDADIKLFLTASAEARAERRLEELRERGIEAISSRVLQDMKERDARDQARAVAPMVPAEDAIVLDTTDLDADAAFEECLERIASRGVA